MNVRAIILTTAMLASGCASVRAAREAQDEASAIPGERTPAAAELGLPASGTIGLAQVVSAALAAHPSIVQARRSAAAAAARRGEVEGAFWPQAATGPTAQFRWQSTDTSHPESGTGHGFQAFGFNVSWLIFDFGRTPALARGAAASALAAERDLRAVEVEVAYGVRAAYFALAKQRELHAVARETVRQFERRLAQVDGFVRAGTRAPYDLTKAQVDLGNARLGEIRTRNAVRSAGASLAGAIGLAEVTEWVPEPGPPPERSARGFDETWELARRTQPALAAARAREDAASCLVDAQIAALYPTISFAAGYNASGGSFPLLWGWSLGPSVSWVIFNGFTNHYSIDEAAASLRGARAARTATEQQVWLEVREAWIALEDGRERLDLTLLTTRQAAENLALAEGRYAVGRATAVDLTDAQVALAQARAERVQARADYDTAVALLWKAIGVTDTQP